MDKDEVLEAWVACVVKTRRGDLASLDNLCLGENPLPKSTTEKNGFQFCSDTIWIRTFVNSNFVSFCKTHSDILLNYLNHEVTVSKRFEKRK